MEWNMTEFDTELLDPTIRIETRKLLLQKLVYLQSLHDSSCLCKAIKEARASLLP